MRWTRHAELEVLVVAVRHQQRGLFRIELAERGAQGFGLVRVERPGLDHGQFLLREFCGERRAQRAEQHLFRQRVFIGARARAMHGAAMAPQRRADRADTRASRALLLPQLAAGAADFALFLGLVRAAAQPGEVPPGGFVQEVAVDLGAKDRVRQIDLADFLSV